MMMYKLQIGGTDTDPALQIQLTLAQIRIQLCGYKSLCIYL